MKYTSKLILNWEEYSFAAPEEEWIYSYDFRDKTTTQLANDGWLNTTNLTTWSSGITASNWTAVLKDVSWLATIMSTANKLTLELQTSITNTYNCTAWLLLTEDLNFSKQCWCYYDSSFFSVVISSNEIDKTSHVKSTWTKNITCEFDFVNKTYSGNYVWGNGMFSWTLTDAQIANVRNLGCIYMPLENGNLIQTIKITVI